MHTIRTKLMSDEETAEAQITAAAHVGAAATSAGPLHLGIINAQLVAHDAKKQCQRIE